MSKALIIKGADFSTNKVATITFGTVPCTAIALNVSTLDMLIGGSTATLTATLTPANTTDTLSWASSDGNVVTVEDGVVTVVGLGTATITATCGEQTATCTVVVTANMADGYKVSGYGLSGTATQSSGNGQIYPDADAKKGFIGKETGTYQLAKMSGSDPNVYPFIIPTGVTKVKISVTDNDISPYRFFFFNSNATAQGSSTVVKGIARVTPSMMEHDGNEWTFDIPHYDGETIDSTVISMQKTTNWSDNDFNSFVIEFIKETT